MCCWKVFRSCSDESSEFHGAEAKHFKMSFSCCSVLKYFKMMWHRNHLGKNRFSWARQSDKTLQFVIYSWNYTTWKGNISSETLSIKMIWVFHQNEKMKSIRAKFLQIEIQAVLHRKSQVVFIFSNRFELTKLLPQLIFKRWWQPWLNSQIF